MTACCRNSGKYFGVYEKQVTAKIDSSLCLHQINLELNFKAYKPSFSQNNTNNERGRKERKKQKRRKLGEKTERRCSREMMMRRKLI